MDGRSHLPVDFLSEGVSPEGLTSETDAHSGEVIEAMRAGCCRTDRAGRKRQSMDEHASRAAVVVCFSLLAVDLDLAESSLSAQRTASDVLRGFRVFIIATAQSHSSE